MSEQEHIQSEETTIEWWELARGIETKITESEDQSSDEVLEEVNHWARVVSRLEEQRANGNWEIKEEAA